MTTLEPVVMTVLPDGYVMRPAQMSDLEAVVDLCNATSQAMYGRDEFTPDDLRFEWTLPNVVPENNFRVVTTPDGNIVGYIEVWDIHSLPVHPWVWARVHPDYENQGIGTALMTWAEERCYAAIDRCPPEARISFRTGCKSGHAPSEQLFTTLGMQPIRHSWTMLIEFDTPPAPAQMPEGISIRTYRHPEDLAITYQAVNDSFRDHFGHVEELFETGLERWRGFVEGDSKFDETLWFLAIDDATGEVAAISLCRIEAGFDPEMGWVNTLGVRRPWRKRGLGLAILQHSFHELWKRGKQKVGLGVDASNLTGATRLYEKAGMHVYRQMTLFEKEIRPGVEISTTSVRE